MELHLYHFATRHNFRLGPINVVDSDNGEIVIFVAKTRHQSWSGLSYLFITMIALKFF